MSEVNSNLVYRPLNKNEFDSYRETWLDCLKNNPDNFGFTYEEEAVNPALKFSHIFKDGTTSDFVCGAFEENKLIGICGFIRETLIKTKHGGTITQMYVKNDFHGKGVGAKLLQTTIEIAFADPAIEQLTLTVVVTNKSARTIYEKMGFKKYGILENRIKNKSGYVADTFMVLSRADYFAL